MLMMMVMMLVVIQGLLDCVLMGGTRRLESVFQEPQFSFLAVLVIINHLFLHAAIMN